RAIVLGKVAPTELIDRQFRRLLLRRLVHSRKSARDAGLDFSQELGRPELGRLVAGALLAPTIRVDVADVPTQELAALFLFDDVTHSFCARSSGGPTAVHGFAVDRCISVDMESPSLVELGISVEIRDHPCP